MESNNGPRIAIIGGGFSGSLTAAHVLRYAKEPVEICLIERRPPFGAGTAFNTSLPCHLLNVPAIRMSAYGGDPEHLLRWLRQKSPHLASPSTFLPRQLYGEYVARTLTESARGSAATLRTIVGEAVAVEVGPTAESPTVRLRDGSSLAASSVVLAIGNQPPCDPVEDRSLLASPRYAPDPWDASALDPLAPSDTVITIGSNLTMVDVALALEYRKHRGPMIAISRHGLLPLPHRADLLPPWTLRTNGASGGPRDLMRAIRREARTAAAQGAEWRSIVDGLRPNTGRIWGSWRDSQRSRFIRHARPYWEVHRHRMAPENAKTIETLLDEGRLRVVAGRIVGSIENRNSIEIHVACRGSSRPETFGASRVVNCTGPGMDYLLSRDTLIRGLLSSGLARPGPLGLGFATGPHGALIGSDEEPSPSLFTLGPPLKGRYWETTAIPEIREQAEALALVLLRARPMARPRSRPSHGRGA